MTRDEWTAISELIDSWWPGEFTEADERAWFDLLGGFGRDVVRAALGAAAVRCPRFRPAAPEVLELVRGPQLPAPSWTDARAVLFGRAGLVRLSMVGSDALALELAGEAHPYLRAFCERYGFERLRMEPIEDPDIGGAVLARMAREWADHVRVCGERVEAGRSLEAMGRRGELGRLDPLSAIQGGRLPELEAGAA